MIKKIKFIFFFVLLPFLGFSQSTIPSLSELKTFTKEELKFVGKSGKCANGSPWRILKDQEGRALSAILVENEQTPDWQPKPGTIIKIKGRCFVLSKEEAKHGLDALRRNVFHSWHPTIFSPAYSCIKCDQDGKQVPHTSVEVDCRGLKKTTQVFNDTATIPQEYKVITTTFQPKDTTIFGLLRKLDKCDSLYIFKDSTFVGGRFVFLLDSIRTPPCEVKHDTFYLPKIVNTCDTVKKVFALNKGLFIQGTGSISKNQSYNTLWGLEVGWRKPIVNGLFKKSRMCIGEAIELTGLVRKTPYDFVENACGCNNVPQRSPTSFGAKGLYIISLLSESRLRPSFGIGGEWIYSPVTIQSEPTVQKTSIMGLLNPRLEYNLNKNIQFQLGLNMYLPNNLFGELGSVYFLGRWNLVTRKNPVDSGKGEKSK